MANADGIPIGTLRWPVQIYRREQAASLTDPGITETPLPIARVHADIQALGPITFWVAAGAAEQVDTPVTHRITIRWLDYIDVTHIIVRVTRGLDRDRTEIFRIRRITEWTGRKRFALLECELESVPT